MAHHRPATSHPHRTPALRVLAGIACACSVLLTAALAGCNTTSATGAQPETDARAHLDPGSSSLQRSILREKAIVALVRLSKDEFPAVRANAIEAIARVPTRAAEVVSAALDDENEGVRAVAAMVVGQQRMVGIAVHLHPLVQDPSPYVQSSAIFGLMRCGKTTNPTPLSDMLLDASDGHVRSHVAYLLGEMGDPSATMLLRDAARRRWAGMTDAQSRMFELQIAEALYKLGDREQIESVRAALYPAQALDLEATALAAQIVGKVGDQVTAGQLINLVDHTEAGRAWPAEIRLACASSLAQLGHTQGGYVADEYAEHQNPILRAQAAHVYGQTGREEYLPKLEALLADRQPVVQVSAASAIVHILGSKR